MSDEPVTESEFRSVAKRIACQFSLFALFIMVPGCEPPGYQFDESTAVHHRFSGEKAFDHVRAIFEMGPRPAGSEQLEKSRKFLEEKLLANGWQVRRQTFTSQTQFGEIEFVNLRARFGSEESEALWQKPVRVLVASHYDTKKFGFDFVGANDPASSMGALLHFAEVAAAKPGLAKRLELVFFDGEEAFGTNITTRDGLYGSREYGRKILRHEMKNKLPKWGVLLDMVGDRDLSVRVPNDSPGELVSKLFSAAEDLGYRKKFGVSNTSIIDDHVPLNVEGVPTIDVIDFDYQYWHTPADTLDKLSPESLEIVGKTVLLLVEKYLLGEE